MAGILEPLLIFRSLRASAVLLLLLIMILAVAFHTIAAQGIFLVACFGSFIVFGPPLTRVDKTAKLMGVALIAACLVVLPLNAFRHPTSTLHFLMVAATFIGAMFATRDRKEYEGASLVTLLAAQVVAIGFILVRGTQGQPLEDIIPNTSSNGITSYLICLQANYCLVKFRLKNSVALFTSGLTVYICLIGYGRASIISSVAIFVVCLPFAFRYVRASIAIPASIALIGVIGALLVANWQEAVIFLESSTKIGSGFSDDARSLITEEYLRRTEGWRIIFGTSFDGTVTERFFNGNPHNSYIRGHHFLGLLYILVILAMACRHLALPYTASQKIFFTAMIGIMLFRAITEPILFPTALDLLFFSSFLTLNEAHGSLLRQDNRTQSLYAVA